MTLICRSGFTTTYRTNKVQSGVYQRPIFANNCPWLQLFEKGTSLIST